CCFFAERAVVCVFECEHRLRCDTAYKIVLFELIPRQGLQELFGRVGLLMCFDTGSSIERKDLHHVVQPSALDLGIRSIQECVISHSKRNVLVCFGATSKFDPAEELIQSGKQIIGRSHERLSGGGFGGSRCRCCRSGGGCGFCCFR